MSIILKVAIPIPVRKTFDYLPPATDSHTAWIPGCRVLVPFGPQTKIGVLLSTADSSEIDTGKLKRILAVIDNKALISLNDLDLLFWAARYYHHPIGEVISAAFPTVLRKGRQAELKTEQSLFLTERGKNITTEELPRAHRQFALIEFLKTQPQAPTQTQLDALGWNWRTPAKNLLAKKLIERKPLRLPINPAIQYTEPSFKPNTHQQDAINKIQSALGSFGVFLLDGVTGSGKTEVYFQLIRSVIHAQQQVMILLPEISLTPQLESRFLKRFNVPIAVFHSRLTEQTRCRAWLQTQNGTALILLGTRSAVFTPLKRPGLIILDEEHDPSYKQQENFRFSARNIAIKRAQQLKIPVVLGSATPSFETLVNTYQGRYQHLRLPQRATGAMLPVIRLLDIRNLQLSHGLSARLIQTIKQTLAKNEQVLLFLNRRGYAPSMICNSCGWVAQCHNCDANLVIHARDQKLICHHCGYQQTLPSTCNECHSPDLEALGIGTERVEDLLTKIFPAAKVQRVDRDSTRRKGSLNKTLDDIKQGNVDILVGTQMLAKGHHFPNVTLVGVLDTDAGLFSTDFRAMERLAQLILQVSGRAGREQKPGRVILQTRHPEHPSLQMLIEHGYERFAHDAIAERKRAGLPPFSHQALIRADAKNQDKASTFLIKVGQMAKQTAREQVLILGPAPAPMTRRAGTYRFQLLIQSSSRRHLHNTLDKLLPDIGKLPKSAQVKWSIDIDPIDLF